MKKVLLISNMYPSEKYPHYGIFVKNTKDILTNEGYTVDVCSIKKNTNKVIKIISYFLFFTKSIFKGCIKKYDCIYAHYASFSGIPFYYIKKMRPKVKAILNIHGNDLVPEDEKDQKMLKNTIKAMNISDIIIVPSNYFKEILIEKYNISLDKIRVFPSGGVNTNIFYEKSQDKCRELFKFKREDYLIGFVSRIEKNKGWDTLIEAFYKLKKIKMSKNVKGIIVGNGNEIEKLKKILKKYSLIDDIILFDYMNHVELSNLYNSLNLFIFPTYRKSESLGLVGLEAMACKTVIISSDKYGPSTYVKDGINGFSFETMNSDSLMKKILMVMDLDSNEISKIKMNAIKTAECYSLKENEKILKTIFDECLEGTKK